MNQSKPALKRLAVMFGVLGWILCQTFSAYANPVNLTAGSVIAFPIVAVSALTVEAGIVALFLTFRGLAPLRVFFGYFLMNLGVFAFVFAPLLYREILPIPILEILTLALDGCCIKLLANMETFQGDDYEGVTWLRSVLISCAGNAASFFVGIIATQQIHR